MVIATIEKPLRLADVKSYSNQAGTAEDKLREMQFAKEFRSLILRMSEEDPQMHQNLIKDFGVLNAFVLARVKANSFRTASIESLARESGLTVPLTKTYLTADRRVRAWEAKKTADQQIGK